MKVAITATGSDLESSVDPRFGRAKFFVVCDTETGDFEVVDNKMNVNAMQGAGIQAAQTIADRGVGCVITGHCGPKAFATLKAAGISVVVGASGTVRDALEQYKNGQLKATDSSDVEAHW